MLSPITEYIVYVFMIQDALDSSVFGNLLIARDTYACTTGTVLYACRQVAILWFRLSHQHQQFPGRHSSAYQETGIHDC